MLLVVGSTYGLMMFVVTQIRARRKEEEIPDGMTAQIAGSSPGGDPNGTNPPPLPKHSQTGHRDPLQQKPTLRATRLRSRCSCSPQSHPMAWHLADGNDDAHDLAPALPGSG